MPQTNEATSSTVDPPPFDPLQPSIPISYPIDTLEDLESRAYFKSFHYPFNKSSVPLKSSAGLEKRPRILVCHDFKGGYVDDKWVQGGNVEGAYAIWHWYLIDVFVYFSHHLVTLPPPCWTNTAHRHGVKVLGTFIVEGDEGRKRCDQLLATKASAQLYAERLAELAANLGFDGWLMNIEVSLDKGQVPNLIEFVSHLTKVMHSSVPGSLVIWYDSVTITGQLSYQNQLNDRNKPFFDVCDGLFANYWWEEDYPKQSAAVAGDRKYDVYMGVDVWGRSTFGGGEWKTNVALDVCKKDDVSSAIFAPGWVYETDQPPDFQTAQNKWWSLVEKSWGPVKFYPNTLPFYSNFDQGRGFHISSEGKQVSNSPWNNLSPQGLQPFLEFKDNPNPDTIQILVDFKEASYSGGVNITFKGTLQGPNEFTARLFLGNLVLDQSPLHMTYSVKSDTGSLLGLALNFSSSSNERKSVLIAPCERNESSRRFDRVIVPRRVLSSEMAPGWVIQQSSIDMNGYTLTEIHAICYRPKPETRKLRFGHDEPSAPNPSDYLAVLGHISISSSKENPVFPPASSWLVEGQNIKWSPGSQGSKSLSVRIGWKLKDRSEFQFSKYNIYVEKITKNGDGSSRGRVEGTQDYIGVAFVEAFYVSELSIASGISGVKFIIQVGSIDGVYQKLEDSPFFQLNVEATHQVTIDVCNLGETILVKKPRSNEAIPGRRYIKHKDHENWIWNDVSLQERVGDVMIDLIRRVGKMETQIIMGRGKERVLSWLLLIFLVLFCMIAWILSHDVAKIILGET